MKTLEQPLEKDWQFVEELKKPLHTRISWERKEKRETKADLSKGVSLHFAFRDPERLLDMLFKEGIPDPLGLMANSRAGAMSILIGIAGNKSIAAGKPIKIKELLK